MEEYSAEWRAVPAHWKNRRIHFFKYMSSETARIVLENRTLRWSCSNLLNDAWEMNFEVLAELNDTEFKQRYLERLWELYTSKEDFEPHSLFGQLFKLLREKLDLSREEIYAEFGEAYDEAMQVGRVKEVEVASELRAMLEKVKVLCLTGRPDNNLMWAHYAQGHTGIVLRFKSSPILDSVFGAAEQVVYQDEAPVLYSEDTLLDFLCGLKRIDPSECFRQIVTTKSTDWAYEEEWRINGGDGREPEAQFEDGPFNHLELDGVIFGSRFPVGNQNSIRDLCGQYPYVKFFQAATIGRGFGINITPIE